MGISGVVAVIGGVLFIALAVGTLLFGARRERGPAFLPTVSGGSNGGLHAAPHDLRGTLTLCLIFLGIFLVIYATHWINLASLWRIG